MSRRKGNVLKRYEGANLLFFLAFAVVLAGFVAWVFQSYRDPGVVTSDESGESNGVVSELISPDDSCIFYLSTRLSESGRIYRGKVEIPPTDDGLVRELFGIGSYRGGGGSEDGHPPEMADSPVGGDANPRRRA